MSHEKNQNDTDEFQMKSVTPRQGKDGISTINPLNESDNAVVGQKNHKQEIDLSHLSELDDDKKPD